VWTPRIPARALAVWGRGAGWRWPAAQALRPGAVDWRCRARPTGLQLGSAAGIRCGERLLAAAGHSASERRAETQRVLCSGSRARLAGAAVLARSGRAACGQNQPAGGGKGDFRQRELRPDRRHGAAQRGVGGARRTRSGDQSARSFEAAGHALRAGVPSGRTLRLARAPAGNTAGHKAAQPRAVRVLGAWPWARRRWLWRWKAHRSALHGRLRRLAAMGQAGQSLSQPCRGWCGKLRRAALACLERLAGLAPERRRDGNAQTPKRGDIAAEPMARLLQSYDGFRPGGTIPAEWPHSPPA